MSYAFPPDVQQLVAARLSTGHYANEDDVLRDALRALVDDDEDVLAVQEAVAEWRDGDDGIPLADAFAQVRRTHTETAK